MLDVEPRICLCPLYLFIYYLIIISVARRRICSQPAAVAGNEDGATDTVLPSSECRLHVRHTSSLCNSFSFHGVLFMGVVVSTMDCQFSRVVAFFHADERPIFSGFRSASNARNQVWWGLPTGRFQSGGGFWIAAVTARCWSSLGELCTTGLHRLQAYVRQGSCAFVSCLFVCLSVCLSVCVKNN